MAHTRRPLIFFLGLVLCAVPGFAQKARTEGTPAARFRVMAVTDNVPGVGVYYLKGPKDGVSMTISKHRLSPPIIAGSTTTPLVFGTKATDPEGAVVFKPVTQASWPDAAATDALVFLGVSGAGAAARVSALAVDNSPAVFPLRTVRVINFSGQKILGQFGSFRGEFPPGASRAVPYPEVEAPKGGVGRFQIGMGMAAPDGSMDLIFSGWTEAWPQARTIILISPSSVPGSDRPKVRFMVDAAPPPPSPPPPGPR